MLEAFWISTRLRISYRVNGILFWLKRIPLLGKLLPAAPYQISGLKRFALVLAVIWELLTFFLGKLVYLCLFFLPAISFYREKIGMDLNPTAVFQHIFLFLTLAGAFAWNHFVVSDANSHYAVFLLGMDAKRYALSNYLYFLFKTAVGFAGVIALGYCLLPDELQLSAVWIPLLPLLVISAKLVAAAGDNALFHKTGRNLSDPSLQKIDLGIPLLLIALAYGLPLLGWTIPSIVLYLLTGLLALLAMPSALYLFRFRDYRRIYQTYPYKVATAGDIQKTEQENLQKKLVLKASSNKTGCAYFNELFFQRHRKLLQRPAQFVALFIGFALLALFLATKVDSELAEGLGSRVPMVLPGLPMLMYWINRGQKTTQILFFNCDHSMLSYRFYRQPSVILPLLWARLRMLIRINLLPATVMAVGLPLLMLLCGGAEHTVDYLILPVAILALSVFFSTHYLVLYYLLQPYTAGLETKNPTYTFTTLATYFACYQGAQALGEHISSLLFGLICIGFSLLYVVVALVLVHRLAPRTFRLRQ